MLTLGRVLPPDFEHVEKYPLADLEAAARPVHVPVHLGANWYTTFDSPSKGKDGKWRLPSSNKLGTIRGGHCICLEPAPDPSQPGHEQDTSESWRLFYNQGQEGACEGFAHARGLSLLHRKKFDALWLYDQARLIDGDPDPNHAGTTNRAVCEVLRTQGIPLGHGEVLSRDAQSHGADAQYGISTYRWATTVDEVLAALGMPGASEVPFLNSWGDDYPHVVYIPDVTLARLLKESGEADVITER